MSQIEQPHMNPVDKELIEEKFKNVYLKIETNHKELKILLEQILEQTLKTNGRVTSLEDDLQVARVFSKKPKILWYTALGLFSSFFIKDVIMFISELVTNNG